MCECVCERSRCLINQSYCQTQLGTITLESSTDEALGIEDIVGQTA